MHSHFPSCDPVFSSGAFDLWDQTCNEHPSSHELSQQQWQFQATFFRGQTRADPVWRGSADAAGRGHQAAVREKEASNSTKAPEEEQRTLHHWHEWPWDQRIASLKSMMGCLCGRADLDLDSWTGGRTARLIFILLWRKKFTGDKMCWKLRVKWNCWFIVIITAKCFLSDWMRITLTVYDNSMSFIQFRVDLLHELTPKLPDSEYRCDYLYW